jgi:Putative DNA-binding domain
MRIARPILNEADFTAAVKLGITTESLHLDLKAAFSKGKDTAREVATDIAAFQNTWGGTLLFGLREERMPTGIHVARDILGVPFEEARKAVEQAVANWLRPALAVDCRPIRLQVAGEEKILLAVNVAPDERLVAVRSENHGLHFPYRTNEGNGYMSADEVIERAKTATRAGLLAMRRATAFFSPPEAEMPVFVASGTFIINPSSPTGFEYRRATTWLVRMEDHQFLLRLGFNPQAQTDLVDLPYGIVRHVWRSQGHLALILDAKLVHHTGGWFLRSE